MKKRYFYLLGFAMLLFSQLSFSQGLVSVNNFTGTANVVVPLYNVGSGSVNVPITAVYSGGGVRVKDVEGNAGMGWNLNAGGGVYRTVRGLPDDIKKDNSNNARLGWLYNTNATKIDGFTIANTGAPNCYAESADIGYINSNFNDLSDTEPDVYSVGAPGLSCQLYIDGSQTFKIAPYRDYKIKDSVNATTGAIVSFTITNDAGTVYKFSTIESETKTLEVVSLDSLQYFKRDYYTYQHGITYNTAWRLTSITDVRGNSVLFEYSDQTTYRSTPIRLNTFANIFNFTQFKINEHMFTKALTDIATSDRDNAIRYKLFFNYHDYPRVGKLLSSIEGYGRVKSFVYTDANKRGDGTYAREFLRQVNTGDQQYTFTYKGLSNSVANPRISLPDSTTYKIDLWGYYNGGTETTLLPQVLVNPANTAIERYRNIGAGTNASSYSIRVIGAYRNANVDSVQIGTLDTLKYSKGGFTKLTYESNDYYDGTADSVIHGGGIRIKQIQDFDGISSTAVSAQNYSYINPATGITSGKPIAVPVFQFTTPYSGPGSTQIQWEYSTVRSEVDLSPEDKSIIYSHVTVSQSGAGHTLYQYTTPATQWNASLPSDWEPTKTYVARTDCSINTFCTSDVNTYPFPNNPNYDFERGLLTSETSYNEANAKVSESAYTYTRTNSPTTITAFKFDDNLTDVAYAKYKIYVNTDELTSNVTTKVYDLNSTTLYKQNSVSYFYDGIDHKLMTKQQATGSDGTINITHIKYVKDYFTTTGSDTVNKAIRNLEQLNCNIPIETWMQTQRDSLRTTGGSLVKFKTFTFTGYADQYLPNHKLQFVSARGVTDFTPSTILSGVFSYDSRYVVKENDDIYSPLGYLETADDANHNIGTQLTDPLVMQTVAAFSNARVSEIGFSNFDSSLPDVSFAGDYLSLTSGHTGNGIHTNDDYGLYRTISKKVNVSNYIFSAWLRPTANGHITIGMDNGTAVTYYTLNFTASDKYVYYQMKVPLAGMGATFRALIFFSVDTSVDDIIMYPENAQVATSGYNTETQTKAGETNTNGKSVYYSYDAYNRLKIVQDNDGLIVQHKSYVTRNGSDTGGMGTVTLAASADNMTGSFVATIPPGDDQEGIKYIWNFGDSTVHVIRISGNSITHEYATNGTYTVTLTVTSPFYPAKVITTSVVISGTSPSHFFNVSGTSFGDGSANILKADFYQGSTLVYSFSQDELQTGIVTAASGNYTVKLLVTGQAYNGGIGTGYKSILATTSGSTTITDCTNFIMGKTATYTFFMNLTSASITSVGFAPQIVACP